MLGYVTIGAADTGAAVKFYDAVLGEVGAERKFLDGAWAGYGKKGADGYDTFICSPADGQPARAGNGIMIAFQAKTTGEVEAAYQAGLRSGGTDEGKPGPRPADSKIFYGAYLRDPTGNKICVFCRPGA